MPGVPTQGMAVQVDPIKPVLKAPGTILLKLRCDGPLSNVAFKFNLRRQLKDLKEVKCRMGCTAGAYTRHSSAHRKHFVWDT